MSPAPDKPGHRFAYWLGQVFRDVREDHGLSIETVAGYVGVSHRTIRNFEGREDEEGKPGRPVTQPQDVEGIVAGLAELVGLDDPRDIYADAVRRWYRGAPPPVPKRPETPILRLGERAQSQRDPELPPTRRRPNQT